MGDPPLTSEQATAALTGPGGYFELATGEVLGEPINGDSEYAVFDDAGERRVLTFGGLQRKVASVVAALATVGSDTACDPTLGGRLVT